MIIIPIPKKGFKNKYIITGDSTIIYIDKKNHGTMEYVIDTKNLQRLIDVDLSWHAVYTPHNDSYYAQASVYVGRENGKSIYEFYNLHTFLMNADASKGEVVDHIDHNTFNTMESNLRVSVNLQNTKNRKSKNSNNKSGYRNVFWSTGDAKWLVMLQVNGKQTCFGRYKLEDVDLAGIRAEEARQEIYGEFAGSN